MMTRISRRSFFNRSLGIGAGAVLFQRFPGASSRRRVRTAAGPFIITSHRNQTGRRAMEVGWEVLAAGGSALDAVERAANVIEVDPVDTSVGYGGLPNEDGVVQLDASIMDGRTYSAGSVAALENIKTPCSVARKVMEHTDHVMLVGRGALEFARAWGFEEENLLTEKARRIWLRWKERQSDRDDWGPPDHLKNRPELKAGSLRGLEGHHGTTNVLAVDAAGDVAGVTTTSGLSFKLNGRVGDSPIIGAGLYVDNDVGAAGATGRGEDVIKSCASYYIVLRMRDGRSPQQACEDALRMIVDKYRHVNPEFVPAEKFVAIDKAGEVGCAAMSIRRLPRVSVMRKTGFEIIQGTAPLDGAG
ncbi:MAG: N(4)-(beta-N-acetylglucosaminyl)-L-asparaginase [Gemmatimonadota bacterium]